MKRFILLLISSCAVVFAYSQEEIILDSIPKISSEAKAEELHMESPLNFGNLFSIGEIKLLDQLMFNQPLLPDYTKNIDFSKYLNPVLISSESFSVQRFGFLPFYSTGAIFNQATYRLNDRLLVGGSSFGAQTVFDKPRINSSMQDMSTKGASMFMQYKVSKNFRIETRVSISNHKSPWEP